MIKSALLYANVLFKCPLNPEHRASFWILEEKTLQCSKFCKSYMPKHVFITIQHIQENLVCSTPPTPLNFVIQNFTNNKHTMKMVINAGICNQFCKSYGTVFFHSIANVRETLIRTRIGIFCDFFFFSHAKHRLGLLESTGHNLVILNFIFKIGHKNDKFTQSR